MSARVEVRSDHAYIGYPVAFYWQDERLTVDEVMTETRNPSGFTFQVRTPGHGIFILTYDIITDQWSVEQV